MSHTLATNRAGILLVVICLSLMALAAPGTARATHGDSSSSFTDRDNNTQDWDKHSLTTAGVTACTWGADELGIHSEITMRANRSGDLHCYDASYSDGWFGYTNCTDVNWWNNRCDHYRIRFNLRHYGQISNDFERNAYRYIGCHEFGHTSSIGHRGGSTSSCMKSGSGNLHFDTHDTSAINVDA